ncbi:MAG TPA: cohesin domain-containing protein [Bryobacteraceae bacterium]|nr:cohesin domain-containing protein [Bryobacteraceae bacterium]
MMAVGPVAQPLQARTRKGDNLLKKGREAEVRKQWETALDFYEQAMLEDPGDSAYVIAARRVRFQAGMARVDAGQTLRSAGQLEEALVEFQKAYAIDPTNAMAEQEYKRTKDMIEREKNPQGRAATTPEERGMTPAERAQKEAEEKSARIMAAPELKPLNPQLNGGLTIRNQPVRVLYETVGKLAGINVIFDPEYQAPQGPRSNYTIELANTSLEEALDYISIQTKSYWKPLSANAIFVTNDNVTKRRDYEDYVVKVFYIKNATTVQELTEISTTVRSVAEIRRAFTYNAQNAILIRGTADQVALAEKLIQDLDKPRAEVVVDVIVMEANRGRVRDLAATLTTGGKPELTIPIVYGKTGSAGSVGEDDKTTTSITLNKIGSIGSGDFSTIVPGALLKLFMSDNQTRVIQQPQVRAVDNVKASLRIGDKIPFASGSFQPGVGGGVGLNPLVSTQFQFADVGVNVDITPKVHGRDEISMQIELEISNVSSRVEIGGVSQPIISQKKIVHNIRLKEGEVNLLGGLLQTQDSRGIQGIPWLAELPVLGRFFSTEHKEQARGELLIALIPHVVRAPEYTDANLTGIAAGSDQNVKLSYRPRPMPVATPEPAAQTPPATAAPAAPVAPAAQPAKAAEPVQPRLIFNPATANVQVNAPVEVQLVLENVTDLYTAPVKLKFDPKILRLTSIRPGPMMSADGQNVNFTESTLNDTGDATITLNRIPGSGGVTGSGPILSLTFQAIGRGTSPVSVTDAGVKNLQLQPIPVSAPSMSITVQ